MRQLLCMCVRYKKQNKKKKKGERFSCLSRIDYFGIRRGSREGSHTVGAQRERGCMTIYLSGQNLAENKYRRARGPLSLSYIYIKYTREI